MRRRPRNCPECGSSKVAEIMYGYPSKELQQEASRNPENPSIVLGGCCVAPGIPRWHCNECEHQWGEAII